MSADLGVRRSRGATADVATMTALAAACLLLCAGLNAVSGGETAFDRDFDFPWVTDPDKMAEEKVQFELYTRENLDMPEVVTMAELPVQLRYMDASRRTNIVVHGWGGPRWMRNLTNAFLTKEDLNVVVVNWSELDTFLYPVAAQRRKSVARQVGGFINFLVNTEEGPGLALSDLHLVGHSLGAHIAGMSSLHVDGTISRITGLDPASPLIPNDTDFRLDKTHAAFVDVIHTCGNVYGWRHPIGHADFYPNGGFAFQPGCVVEDLFTGKCSHNFAYSLFRESILLDGTFPALPSRLPLDSKSPCTLVDKDAEPVQMGLGAPHSARGVYCLATRPKAPFGFGPEVVLPSSNATVATEAQIAFMKIIFPLT